jgi:putative oxidoreductase
MIDMAILILRLCLAIVFVAHGAQVAFAAFGGPGIDNFSKMLAGLGFKPALLWAYIGAYTEFIGGLCLLAGFFTRLAAAFILVFISVAAFKVHLAKGFFVQAGGFEYNFVIACICIALILSGGGKFGVNKF